MSTVNKLKEIKQPIQFPASGRKGQTMLWNNGCIWTALAVVMLAAAPARGDEITLSPIRDSYLNYDSRNTIYGDREYLYVAYDENDCDPDKNTVIFFDTAAIPSGAPIVSATLYLYCYDDGQGSGDFYVEISYGYLGLSWPDEMQVTWNHRHKASNWWWTWMGVDPCELGGLSDVTEDINSPVTVGPEGDYQENQWVQFDVAETVAEWIENGVTNNGFLLYSESADLGGTSAIVKFRSREYTDPNYRPYLHVVWDLTPPTPNPMTFATPPAPTGTSAIGMMATTAGDSQSPPVWYFFNFFSGGSGGNDSDWQLSTSYTDTGLAANTGYTYRVKARDSAHLDPARCNQTLYSGNASTATLIETPTGVSFGTVAANSIVLNATGTLTNLSVGSSGVYFNSTTPGGNGGISEWVQVPTDTATSLSPDTSYAFRVKARNQNAVETVYSPTAAKVTLANIPAAPTLANPTTSTMTVDVNANGNPAVTVFAIQCMAANPGDPNWVGKYVSATGTPSASAVWQTDATWGITTVLGLQSATTYTFAVKARNQEGVETVFGPGASLATLGEAEDDFGDAPDSPYPTLLLNNGARHTVVPGVYLGAAIDAELDGWQDPSALGDDNHGIDDEDGVSFSTLRPGQPATIQVTASTGGYVSAWLDFDANGSWAETDNRIVNNVAVPGGTTTLDFTVPNDAALGTTFARVRFSTAGGLSYIGRAADGEVEDYQVTILEAAEHDLGDAPDSTNSYGVPMTAYPAIGTLANFPTVYQIGSPPFGPIHLDPLVAAYLGATVTLEDEADIGPDQDPQNNILPLQDTANQDGGDDGVQVPLALPRCQETTFDYLVTVTGTVSPQFYVNVWFDWNRDGDWDDVLTCPEANSAPEWAVQNQLVFLPGPGGPYTFTTPSFLPWHPTEPPEEIWMRITLSEQPWTPSPEPGSGGSGSAHGYRFGETEDYYFVPQVPQVLEPKWVQPPQASGQGFDAVSDLWWPEPPHGPEVNRVMADDFISDGRVVKALNWWGSYWDKLFEPTLPPIEPYVLDGWLIGFHHVEPERTCPPEPAVGDVPTALGVYFAAVGAVSITPTPLVDCLGHTVFVYEIDLGQCCLLCSESDPRLPLIVPPARLDGFHEVSGMRYWLSIQAVVGVEWLPNSTVECEKHLTGHLPSPNTVDGHFWGWHTSAAEVMPQGPLAEACAGRLLDITPPAPACWDYGEWQKQSWLCDEVPPSRVDQAFELLAPSCGPMGDVNGDGAITSDDIPCFVECLVMAYSVGCTCGCADMNRDYIVNGLDVQLFINALLTP
jgi:hypothetical protein